MVEERTREIIKLLKHAPYDMTITEIASKVGVERHTAAKHLEKLHAKGLCEYRIVGRSKLWRLADSPLLSIFKDGDSLISRELASMLRDVRERIVIQNEDLTVIWSNDKRAVNKKCFEVFTKRKTSCPDCPVKRTFEKGNCSTGKGHDGMIRTTPLKENGKTVAVINITSK
ncbi:MAG: HTH domain-containing protein [Nanoarchaeota archaeon]